MSYTVSIFIEAVDRASGVMISLSSALDELGSSLNMAQALASGLATAVGVHLISALEEAVRIAHECAEAYARYEWTLVRIATATGALGREARYLVGQLSELARGMGVELGVGAFKAAEALEELVKAGLEGEEATRALEATLKLAQLELIEAGEAAGYLASIMRAFSLSAEQASHVVDVLVNASVKGIATARDFAYALSFCSGIAAQLGLSLEETVAALVAMNNQGIQATYAGRYLMRMLSDLIEHSDELGFSIYDASGQLLRLSEIIARLEERLATLATDEERAAYLTEVFSTQGMRAALALLNASYAGEKGSEALRALTEAMGEAGTASAMFEEQMSTLAGALSRARARIQDAVLALGKALSPAIEETATLTADVIHFLAEIVAPELLAFVRDLAKGFKALREALSESPEAAELFRIAITVLLYPPRLLSGSIRDVLFFCALLVKAIGTLSRAFEMAFSAMASSLGSFWSSVGPLFSSCEDILYSIGGAVSYLQEIWTSTWNAVQAVLLAIWSAIGPVLQAFLKAIQTIREALEQLMDWLSRAGKAISDFFSGIGSAITGFGKWLVGGSYWPEMLAKMTGCLDEHMGLMEERFERAMEHMRDEALGLGEDLIEISIWPDILGTLYKRAERWVRRSEELLSSIRRHGSGLSFTSGIREPFVPRGEALRAARLTSINVNVHIESFTAHRPEDVEALAREIGREVARELRLRGAWP